ncbi:YheC/YheD family protein [Peribacillus sp. SCS-155]|uniref:YheC/YheD family endospore coat-associated protein n=1 Tax=Peribacillus sedimenti TaxID=3115297 RepID=UPI003905FC06
MRIYYDYSSDSWYHRHKRKHGFFLGGSGLSLPFKPHTGSHLTVHVSPIQAHILTVGIVTGKHSKETNHPSGNLELFRELSSKLTQQGFFPFVFSLDDFSEGGFFGFVYSPQKEGWEKVKVPMPDVVYNRIPSRTIESSTDFYSFKRILKKHSIPIFNPRFIHKYELYQIFKENDFLASLLPETILLESSIQLYTFLKKQGSVYLKPVMGNKGSGIEVLTLEKDNKVTAATTKRMNYYSGFNEFWFMESGKFLRNKYIAQQAIVPKKVDGHRFDYRILVHFENNEYTITGKAVRMSQSQEVTTHVPRGGRLFPYEQVQTEQMDELLEKTAQCCGSILSERLGFFGEFSMDLGEDETGRLFLYEVNSKPMKFDEANIETNRLQKLANIFIQLKYPGMGKT